MISRLTGRPIEEEKPRPFSERFERALASLDRVTDGLGHGIDPGIREPVAALLALGHGTKQSCEGHPMERGPNGDSKPWGTGGPYIDVIRPELVASEDERMRVVKETKVWPAITPENRRTGLAHKMELDGLLDEFYLDRKVDPAAKLFTQSFNGGASARIESRGVAMQEFNQNDPNAWTSSLKSFQVEMQSFGSFLLDKGLELDAQNQKKTKLSTRSPS
jgi:hypothetical protein